MKEILIAFNKVKKVKCSRKARLKVLVVLACHNESDTKSVFAGAGGPLLPYGGVFPFIVQSEQVQRRHLGTPAGLQITDT